jgi:8-oxo-dGTP pyrophosphatase MutT (NUDIX family)
VSIATGPIKSGKSMRPWYARAAAVAHGRLWWTRAVTLGVRAVVLDEANRVLLVRHSYTPGWYLPGGGVDRGETAEAAAIREVREETGVLCRGRPLLHGLFHNARLKRDHVVCYVIRDFDPAPVSAPDWEIAETGFFALDALPEGTTAATRRRLDEVVQGTPVADAW